MATWPQADQRRDRALHGDALPDPGHGGRDHAVTGDADRHRGVHARRSHVRRPAQRRRGVSQLSRCPCRGHRREGPGHRRPLRRSQGADRRLRHPRGRLARRGYRARPQVRPPRRLGARRRTSRRRGRGSPVTPGPDSTATTAMNAANIDATVATLWRVESPRVLARLARFVGDLDTAEELTQDTFLAGIEKWRHQGGPDNPAAWLHTTARYLAVDRIRRRDAHRSKVRLAAAASPQVVEHDFAELVDGDLADDLLGLIFMAAHPILSPDARSALTLKLVCGLDTEDIARAFLVPGPTIAQRVVRAKRTLAAANIRFELPGPAERPARLAAVREVIYLVFNEGYSATIGDLWMRIDLCAEALRLGRMLASLTPHDTESLGLLALMELQASRLKARTGPDGEPVLLMDQDRTRWDHLFIRRGLATL